jgi:hypothetical protein
VPQYITNVITIIYFSKNPQLKSFDLIVPSIADGQAIIEYAHDYGHFKLETTCTIIRRKYYWKKMRHDVKHFINNCFPCLRNETKPTITHPAIALLILDIFDRIDIDLVFGLPLTEDGYHEILIITEYLTKYPWAVSTKSKTAIEIALHLFHYFSIFSPPKEILSDEGNEFNNNLLQTLN